MPFYLMEFDGGNVPTVHEFKNEEAAKEWIEMNVKFDDVDEDGSQLDLFEEGHLHDDGGSSWEIIGEDLNGLITKHE